MATHSPEGTRKNYFSKEKRFLKLLGLSFTGDESWAYRIYSFVFIFSGNFMYPIVMFKEMFKHEYDIVADMLIYEFASTVAFAKTMVVMRNRMQFGKMLDRLEEAPFTVNKERGGEEEEKILGTCLKITNIQTMAYWIVIFITVAISMLYSIIKRFSSSDSRDWELPYGPLTILNITYSPNFELTWCYQMISVISIVSHFGTIDLLMASVLAHTCFQFKMLQNNLRLLVKNSYVEMSQKKSLGIPTSSTTDETNDDINLNSTIPWKYLKRSVQKAVTYHLQIIDMAKDMEALFSELLLLAYLGTLAVQCFLILRLSAMEGRVQTARCVGEIFIIGMQVITVCFWGEQVLFESQEVGTAAYESNFVGTDTRFQKNLTVIMRRSQDPVKLTAGKFADVRLFTFTWIMRTSYSAYMVLRTTR